MQLHAAVPGLRPAKPQERGERTVLLAAGPRVRLALRLARLLSLRTARPLRLLAVSRRVCDQLKDPASSHTRPTPAPRNAMEWWR